MSWAHFSHDGTLFPLGSKLRRAALSVADAPLIFPGQQAEVVVDEWTSRCLSVIGGSWLLSYMGTTSCQKPSHCPCLSAWGPRCISREGILSASVV